MKVIAIIQARLSSSRLPGKVLMEIEGKPVLEHIHNRLMMANQINKIIIATSKHHTDNPIDEWCSLNNIPLFRGSLDNVLSRFYFAAKENSADIIVRITGDCPLIDASIVDELVNKLKNYHFDYACLAGSFPDGLDCSVMTFETLENCYKNASLDSDKEHVCPYIERHPEKFKIYNYQKFENLGHHRWTLDEPEDLKFIKKLFKNLHHKNSHFNFQDILNFLEKNPYLKEINSHIERNAGYKKSLNND